MVKAFFIGNTSDEKNIDWALKLGANVIFTGHRHLGGKKRKKLKLYIEIGIFAGEDLWKEYPDCRPVDKKRKPMPKTHWYHGVCPNHPQVRKEKLKLIKSLVQKDDIDGIWLDSIRYPCHWEEVRSSKITEYCFCPICLKKFRKDTSDGGRGVALLRGGGMRKNWIQWKCDQITNFVADVRHLIDASGKNIELGMFSVPWREGDFGGAIKKIIGQDFKKLAKYVDVFSPMVYHKMCGRPTEWIHETVAYMNKVTGKPILPIIQTEDKPEKISQKEFAQEIKAAIKKPSRDMIIFFLDDLLKDKDKVEILKEVGDYECFGTCLCGFQDRREVE